MEALLVSILCLFCFERILPTRSTAKPQALSRLKDSLWCDIGVSIILQLLPCDWVHGGDIGMDRVLLLSAKTQLRSRGQNVHCCTILLLPMLPFNKKHFRRPLFTILEWHSWTLQLLVLQGCPPASQDPTNSIWRHPQHSNTKVCLLGVPKTWPQGGMEYKACLSCSLSYPYHPSTGSCMQKLNHYLLNNHCTVQISLLWFIVLVPQGFPVISLLPCLGKGERKTTQSIQRPVPPTEISTLIVLPQ